MSSSDLAEAFWRAMPGAVERFFQQKDPRAHRKIFLTYPGIFVRTEARDLLTQFLVEDVMSAGTIPDVRQKKARREALSEVFGALCRLGHHQAGILAEGYCVFWAAMGKKEDLEQRFKAMGLKHRAGTVVEVAYCPEVDDPLIRDHEQITLFHGPYLAKIRTSDGREFPVLAHAVRRVIERVTKKPVAVVAAQNWGESLEDRLKREGKNLYTDEPKRMSPAEALVFLLSVLEKSERAERKNGVRQVLKHGMQTARYFLHPHWILVANEKNGIRTIYKRGSKPGLYRLVGT